MDRLGIFCILFLAALPMAHDASATNEDYSVLETSLDVLSTQQPRADFCPAAARPVDIPMPVPDNAFCSVPSSTDVPQLPIDRQHEASSGSTSSYPICPAVCPALQFSLPLLEFVPGPRQEVGGLPNFYWNTYWQPDDIVFRKVDEDEDKFTDFICSINGCIFTRTQVLNFKSPRPDRPQPVKPFIEELMDRIFALFIRILAFYLICAFLATCVAICYTRIKKKELAEVFTQTEEEADPTEMDEPAAKNDKEIMIFGGYKNPYVRFHNPVFSDNTSTEFIYFMPNNIQQANNLRLIGCRFRLQTY